MKYSPYSFVPRYPPLNCWEASDQQWNMTTVPNLNFSDSKISSLADMCFRSSLFRGTQQLPNFPRAACESPYHKVPLAILETSSTPSATFRSHQYYVTKCDRRKMQNAFENHLKKPQACRPSQEILVCLSFVLSIFGTYFHETSNSIGFPWY